MEVSGAISVCYVRPLLRAGTWSHANNWKHSPKKHRHFATTDGPCDAFNSSKVNFGFSLLWSIMAACWLLAGQALHKDGCKAALFTAL
jgi:hypothetical protein